MNTQVSPNDRDTIYRGNPYEKTMPDYWELAREEYPTIEDMAEWLGVDVTRTTTIDRLQNWDYETIYDYLCEEHRGIIEAKFIGEM